MTSFTVMTCNVGNDRAAPEQLIPAVQSSHADVVGFQELSESQSDALVNQLAERFPHRVTYPGGFAGKAVLSKFPILQAEQIHLSTVRPDLQAKIDINGREINFIVAHPPPPRLYWRGLKFDRQTWRQITTLVKIAIDNPPAVLLGDFNLTDWRGEYAYMRGTGLKDAFVECGMDLGHTLPKRIGPWKRFLTLNRLLSSLPLLPMFRVDYIWYTDPLRCNRARVGQDTGSDHLPVLATLFIEN